MRAETFVAVVYEGKHRNLQGGIVSHITDASCRSCGFVYGRGDVRNEVDGTVRKDQPLVSDAIAMAAARDLGLPVNAALFAHTEAALAREAAAKTAKASRAPAPAASSPPAEETVMDHLELFLAQQRTG